MHVITKTTKAECVPLEKNLQQTNRQRIKLDEFVLQKWWMRRANVNTIFAA
jgi:hypothetical protein